MRHDGPTRRGVLALGVAAAAPLVVAGCRGAGQGEGAVRDGGSGEVPALDATGTPWGQEVHRADDAVREVWRSRPGDRPVVVRLAAGRREFAAAGGSDEVPGITRGLRVVPGPASLAPVDRRGRSGGGGFASASAEGEGVVEVVLHPHVTALGPADRGLVLRHELVHARFDQVVSRAEPLWWREGVAEWVAHGAIGGSQGGDRPVDVEVRPSEPRIEGQGSGARAARYAAARRSVELLARHDRRLVRRVDAAWGSSQLPGPGSLRDFLTRQGVPGQVVREVLVAGVRDADWPAVG